MSVYLHTLSDAYAPLLGHHWEKSENPQHYDQLKSQEIHQAPRRHVLGLVGGNEVSRIKGLQIDLESDLRRITMPLTATPWRQYQPPKQGQTEIVRENKKSDPLVIDIQKAHLPTYQMWAYPAVVAPVSMVNQVCVRPEKY